LRQIEGIASTKVESYQVLIPWAAGYSPTNLDMTQFLPMASGWGIKHLILDMTPPLLAEWEGPPT
jgi:hypothetical protein